MCFFLFSSVFFFPYLLDFFFFFLHWIRMCLDVVSFFLLCFFLIFKILLKVNWAFPIGGFVLFSQPFFFPKNIFFSPLSLPPSATLFAGTLTCLIFSHKSLADQNSSELPAVCHSRICVQLIVFWHLFSSGLCGVLWTVILAFSWWLMGTSANMSGALSLCNCVLSNTLSCKFQSPQQLWDPVSFLSSARPHHALLGLYLPALQSGRCLQAERQGYGGVHLEIPLQLGIVKSAAGCPVSGNICFLYIFFLVS